jgi:hypothetical protein
MSLPTLPLNELQSILDGAVRDLGRSEEMDGTDKQSVVLTQLKIERAKAGALIGIGMALHDIARKMPDNGSAAWR